RRASADLGSEPEFLVLFGEGGLDGNGNLFDQGHSCSRAQVESGAHLISEDHLRGFYRLNGAVGRGLHGALSIHRMSLVWFVRARPSVARSCLLPDYRPIRRKCEGSAYEPSRRSQGRVLAGEPGSPGTTACRLSPATSSITAGPQPYSELPRSRATARAT